jgi:hypothetical protein
MLSMLTHCTSLLISTIHVSLAHTHVEHINDMPEP